MGKALFAAAVLMTALIIILTIMKPNESPTPPPVERPAAQAGRFYEADPKRLANDVDELLAQHANDTAYSNVAALIVPHAGHVYSGNVAAAAYMAVAKESHYKRIFLIGPSHHEWLNGASVNSEADYYVTPLGRLKVDRETAMQLIAADSVFTYVAKAHDREHCLEVQLPFLQRRMPEVPPIVPIIVSTNDYSRLQRIAEALKPYFNDENLFVVSSDFSHYPSYADACKVDAKTAEAVSSQDVERFISTIEENAQSGIPNLSTSACGAFPIITLMLMLNSDYQTKHLLYQNSGDIQRSSRVVGYHAFAILRTSNATAQSSQQLDQASSPFTLSADEKAMLKKIAHESIKNALQGKTFKSETIARESPALQQECGAFVTLHKHGHLRGCIGLLSAQLPLHETVARMAKAAAFEDPRFPKLRADEIPEIDIEISVITPMRQIHSIDEFQLHKHGIFIKKGRRSGTFLPQVADEVNWTKEEFLGHCSRDKAGLGWEGWRDAELYVYEAIVF